MAITGYGWEMLVHRLGIQHADPDDPAVGQHSSRTYGRYDVYIEGKHQFDGFICEGIGPGSTHVDGHRIIAGTYALSTQFGDLYWSQGYQTTDKVQRPAVALVNVPGRTGILVHPAHTPDFFLSSIGCFNPTKALQPKECMAFQDSYTHVVEIVDSLKNFAPKAFVPKKNTPIPNAYIIVEGEPMFDYP